MATTLGQQRAQFCLEQLKQLDNALRDDFKPFTAGLPAMILQNGFGQTLAFLQSKGKKKHLTGFRIIVSWLVNRGLLAPGSPIEQLQSISNMDQADYLRAQQETLAMLEWLKRYANAALFMEEQ